MKTRKQKGGVGRVFTTKEDLIIALHSVEPGIANTWDVSAITDMSFLFKDSSFNDPISKWDVSHVTTMEGMFHGATEFNQALPWDTSSVTNMKEMFFHAASFHKPIIFDTSNVTTMEGMFQYAFSFNYPIQFDTSSVTTMKHMFYHAETFNKAVALDTSKVTTMECMFCGASSFNQPLRFQSSSVTTMEGMFLEATAFNSKLELDTSSVTTMKSMFLEATSFNQPVVFDTSSVTTMEFMFLDATSFNQPIVFDSSSVTTMEGMFFNARTFNSRVQLNTSHVTTMKNMFKGATSFNQPLVFDTSAVTDMEGMFHDAESFNQPLAWDVKRVKEMSYMFYNTPSLFQLLDWDMKGKNTYEMITLSGMDIIKKRPLPKEIHKSITLLVHLHGFILADELKSSVLTTGISICYGKFLKGPINTTKQMLTDIEHAKDKYRGKISEGNRNYSFKSYQLSIEEINEEYEQKYIDWTPEDFHAFHNDRKPSKSRVYIHDKNYGYEDDSFAITMGIYILDDRDYLPLQFPIDMDAFTPERRECIVNEEQYQQLQQRNLMNVDVVRQISSEPLTLHITDKYTQIPHYTNVRLSDILRFFEQLGYNHVNIIDKSCRVGITKTRSIIRKNSFNEKALYGLAEKLPIGGTRKRLHRRLHN
jgi:hypothetical protein